MCAILMEQELRVEEVATRLGVSVQTVMRRIKAGRIKARKEGTEWRIRESDLRAYIESGFDKPDTSRRDTDKFQIVILPPLGEELN